VYLCSLINKWRLFLYTTLTGYHYNFLRRRSLCGKHWSVFSINSFNVSLYRLKIFRFNLMPSAESLPVAQLQLTVAKLLFWIDCDVVTWMLSSLYAHVVIPLCTRCHPFMHTLSSLYAHVSNTIHLHLSHSSCSCHMLVLLTPTDSFIIIILVKGLK